MAHRCESHVLSVLAVERCAATEGADGARGASGVCCAGVIVLGAHLMPFILNAKPMEGHPGSKWPVLEYTRCIVMIVAWK